MDLAFAVCCALAAAGGDAGSLPPVPYSFPPALCFSPLCTLFSSRSARTRASLGDPETVIETSMEAKVPTGGVSVMRLIGAIGLDMGTARLCTVAGELLGSSAMFG